MPPHSSCYPLSYAYTYIYSQLLLLTVYFSLLTLFPPAQLCILPPALKIPELYS